MIDDVAEVFGSVRHSDGARYFTWKPDSLQVMRLNAEHGTVHITNNGSSDIYRSVTKMICLGQCIDVGGTTRASIEFNFGRAETNFYQNKDVLMNRALL